MADIYAGETITPPSRVSIPPVVGGAGRAPHYLDGCFTEEVDAIRIVNSPGPSVGGGGYSTDNIDPLDVPFTTAGKRGLIGSNTPLAAILAGDNRGILRLTVGTTAGGDASFSRRSYLNQAGTTPIGPFVLPVAPKRMWYTTSLRYASTAGNVIATGGAIAGLVPAAYTPTTAITLPTDGIFFFKTETGTSTDFHVRKASTSTSLTNVELKAGQVALALDAVVEYSFQVDEKGNVAAYVNGVLAGTIAAGDANLPVAVALTTGHGRSNNAGATAQTLDQDYELLCYEV